MRAIVGQGNWGLSPKVTNNRYDPVEQISECLRRANATAYGFSKVSVKD